MVKSPTTLSIDLIAAGPFGAVEVRWKSEPAIIRPEVQAYIEGRWQVYLGDAAQGGHMLFDGPVARLTDAKITGTTLRLILEQSNYKTFVVTALRDHAWFAVNAPEAIAGALGNSVLLWHKDRCVLGIRSARVPAYPGRAHLFGGVLEALGTPERPAAREGLVAHLAQELSEELGLTSGDLAGEPGVLSLARDRFLHQPELVWQWELAVPIEAVLDRLNPEEHSGYVIVARDTPLVTIQPALTPAAALAVELWRVRGC